MKILVIGDPHGQLDKIKKINLKKIDLILLTGDLGNANLVRKIAFENIERQRKGLPEKEYSPTEKKNAFMQTHNSTIKLIKYLSTFAPVYTIYGNVESTNSETKEVSREIKLKLPLLTEEIKKIKNVNIINNKLIKFNNLKIGGISYFVDTSWVKEFKPDNYKERLKDVLKETNKAKKILKKFGKIDILICHQPPYKVLDKVTSKFAPKQWQGKHAGSLTILQYIQSHQPKYVFCGHIHEGKGMKKIGKTEVYNLGFVGYQVKSFGLTPQ